MDIDDAEEEMVAFGEENLVLPELRWRTTLCIH